MTNISLREEIYELLGNLSEFGEQASTTSLVLQVIEKRIDSEINKLQESKVLNPCRYDNVLTLNTLKAMLK